MSLSELFNFSKRETATCEIPEIFALSLVRDLFVTSDICHTYQKILTDVIERVHGLPEKFEPALWDNCLQNEANLGLVSLLADAMTKKADLFLVYKVTVLRRATSEEEKQIREDYKKSGDSKVGVFVSFKKYRRTEMLEIYAGFEYCVLAGLNKKLNISKALQIKINELRSSVSSIDSTVAIAQAKAIAQALKNGNDILLDAKDDVTTATPDTSADEKSIAFLDAKRAYILSLPMAYISGEQTGGIGSSGENDMRAIERGLKQYFVSIVQPVLKALFGVTTEFRSQDFRQMDTALNVLKTFDLVSDDTMSHETKVEILARVFDLDPNKEQKQIDAEAKAAASNPPINPLPNPQDPTNLHPPKGKVSAPTQGNA